jgi:hypothetical protein
MFRKKYSLSILDDKWKIIRGNIKLHYIPRKNELIYLEEFKKYFEIINVVHYLNNKQGIFLIIRDLPNK